MLTGQRPDDTTTRTFDTMLILYAEHETNASTFACRVVVGTESDFYSATSGWACPRIIGPEPSK